MKLFHSFLFLGIFLVLIPISTCHKPPEGVKPSKINGSPRFGLDLPGKVFDSAYNLLGSVTEKTFTMLMDRTCRKLIRSGIIGTSGGISKHDLSLLVTNKGEVEDTIILSNIKDLAESDLYSENKTLTAFIPGWLTDLSNGLPGEIKELAYAYGQREDTHLFVILDFRKYLDTTLYSLAALNTEEIGEIFGAALAELYSESKFEKLHLIGANLGAQIAASTAHQFSLITDQEVDRITALDPSIQCFKQGSPLRQLNKNSAKFVDVLHTTKILGTDISIGDADFYTKGYIYSRLPGCDGKLTRITCSYKMAISYYAESVTPGMEENFLGCTCKSYRAFANDKCKKCTTVFGLMADPKKSGDFYFRTNAFRPYGPNKTKPTTTTTARTTTTEEFSTSEEESSTDSTNPTTSTDPENPSTSTIPPSSVTPPILNIPDEEVPGSEVNDEEVNEEDNEEDNEEGN